MTNNTDPAEFMNLEDVNANQIISSPKIKEEKEPLWALIISIILHPLFMTVYSVCLLFLFTDFGILFGKQFLNFFTPVLLLSCVIPATGMYFLRRIGLISDFALTDRSERFLPMLISFFSYIALVYFFWISGLHIFFLWFIALLVAPILLLIITSIINIYWKISAHMTAIGGLTGGFLSVCYNIKGLNLYILFMILFILAGCLGSARLVLKRHTPAQVYAGFLFGFVITYICLWASAKYALFFLKLIVNQ